MSTSDSSKLLVSISSKAWHPLHNLMPQQSTLSHLTSKTQVSSLDLSCWRLWDVSNLLPKLTRLDQGKLIMLSSKTWYLAMRSSLSKRGSRKHLTPSTLNSRSPSTTVKSRTWSASLRVPTRLSPRRFKRRSRKSAKVWLPFLTSTYLWDASLM